ncbi:glycosyltransferase [Aliiroseovarius sp. 2305UL8-7]|uniref:glycosyltransferase n=1 Tax=Aliiroseovarius conchicola TaxID=3121637 RepID=UPI003529CB4F
MSAIRSIFITNNGLSDHIGISQVLPYLEGLAARGHQLACVSVERPAKRHTYAEQVAPRLERAGVMHTPILRSRSPLAGKLERFAMPSQLQHRLDALVRSFHPDLIHCRSYMPLGAVLNANQHHGIPFLFDMRGFWVDERCEAGVWKGPLGKRAADHFRRREVQAINRAAATVTLTHDAKSLIAMRRGQAGTPIETIPCSVDQSRFKPDSSLRGRMRLELGLQDHDVVLAHLGSTGPLYEVGSTYRLMAALRRQGMSAKLLMIGSQTCRQHIRAAKRIGIILSHDDLICRQVPHDQVPALLNAADIGLSFRIASKSSLGVSATKVGEYQSCGLPVISNTGVGDIHEIIPDRRYGLVLASHDDAAIENAANVIATAPFATRAEIRAHAADRFSMIRACDMYDRIYRSFRTERKAA